MKILALVILLLCVFSRIKNTPAMLSKTLYMKKMQKLVNKNNDTFEKNTEEQNNFIKGFAIIFAFLLQVFMFVFYTVLGSKLGNTYFIILTALQCVTVLITTGRMCTDKMFSKNIEDYKFYRLFFLFNVVLDYIYYPIAIYLLMK